MFEYHLVETLGGAYIQGGSVTVYATVHCFRSLSLCAILGTCTVVSVNGTLVDSVKLKRANFLLNVRILS
jgi:hypothetical protein